MPMNLIQIFFFKSWFEKKGINANQFFIENGAGLSRDSYANSLLFQEVLAFIIASDWKSEIISSLPITGIDGTLKSMFKEKSFSNATHLKTGRLKNVFALSGFMKSSKGEEYIVTFVLNGPQYESFLKFIEQSLEYFISTLKLTGIYMRYYFLIFLIMTSSVFSIELIGEKEKSMEQESAKVYDKGLQLIDNVVGDGREAEPGLIVKVHYTGWLYDANKKDNKGEKFDSSLDRNDHTRIYIWV